MKEGFLWGVQEDDRSCGTSDEARGAHKYGRTEIAAHIGPVGGDRRQLAGPYGDCIRGVSLHGQHIHTEQGGKGEKRASSGYGIEDSGQEGGDKKPYPLPGGGRS